MRNILKKIDSNIILDNEQLKVVMDNSKYLLIIAGAGSGKSTTILAKISYLIKSRKAKEEEILLISFTNATVDELSNKLEILGHKVNVVTFHKLGLQILKLKDNTYKVIDNNIIIYNEIITYEWKTNSKWYRYLEILYLMPKSKTFLSIINSNGYKKFLNDLDILKLRKIKISNDKTKIIKDFLKKYENEKNKRKIYDFNDLIEKSTEYLKNTKKEFKYKYIFIDEYQDISYKRLELVLELEKITNANVVAVGDDFQAIYNFAGSEISLFENFSKYFKGANKLYINETYRNSQELIDITGKFIMKNENQLKKSLRSQKHLINPIEIVYFIKGLESLILLNIIKKIANNNHKISIAILGRYNMDNIILNKCKEIKKLENNSYKYNDINIEFMTVHRSKGLTFDYVILVNLKRGYYGFPSNRINNNYLEERRLFYVALTRTKNKVYLLTPVLYKSKFITEIKKLR